MDVSELLDETVANTMEWKGREVHFDARKDSLTPSVMRSIQSVSDYPKAIAEIVTDWDLTDRDPEKKWPLDEESIGKLPVAFLSKMLDTIGESWTGDKKKSEDSPNGSAATGS